MQLPAHARSAILGVVAAISTTLTATARAGTATFQGLGDLGGGAFHSHAYAVSDDGTTVVGVSSPAGAFRWTGAGGMVGLGALGAAVPLTVAHDVSADGTVVVGEMRATTSSPRQPFRFTESTGIVQMVDPTGEILRGQAFAVSADGEVVTGVGASTTGNQAFRWTPATGIAGLGWVPNNFHDSFGFGISGDGNVIVGVSGAPDTEPFRWEQATGMVGLGDVPGGVFYAIANGISGDGSTLVGLARVANGVDEAFFWRADIGFVRPDPLHEATLGSSATAANFDGSIVVGWTVADGAMIWDAVHGMRSLQTVLVNEFGVDLTGWILWSADDISADGTAIVGGGRNPNGQSEAWIARLPAVATSVDDLTREPRIRFALRSANPFRSGVVFELAVPSDGITPVVHAAVYRVDGKLVRTLLHKALAAGPHSIAWDGTTTARSRAAVGSYIVRVQRESDVAVRRVVLLR